jgi:hypothetical protein
MKLKLKGVRKNCRVADLIASMIAKPLVSISLPCREVGTCTHNFVPDDPVSWFDAARNHRAELLPLLDGAVDLR